MIVVVETKLKKGTILDATEQIVARPSDVAGDLNLPPGVQALIEARITQARAELRENIHVDFHRFAEERVKTWKKATTILTIFAGVVLAVFTFWTWFVSPEMVRRTVKDWAATNLVEGPLRERVDSVLAEKGEKWAADKFAPLSDRTVALSDKVDHLSSEISKQQEALRADQQKLLERTETLTTQVTGLSTEIRDKQDSLRADQQRISEQVAIQDLAVAARVGHGDAWTKLCDIASGQSDFAKNAQAAKKDVEQFYDTDRYQLTGSYIRMDTISMKQIHQTLEEAIRLLRSSDSTTRNVAANELADLKLKRGVSALCTAIETEKDLRVVARITRAIQELTDVRFDPLEREKVLAWWASNRDRAEYSFPIAEFEKWNGFFRKTAEAEFYLFVDPILAREAIPHLEAIITAEPKASLTRFFLCVARLGTGDLDGAERGLREAQDSGRQYWRTFILRALIAVQKKEREQAIDALNAGFEAAPANVGRFARTFAAFRDLRDEAKVKWPKPENSSEPSKRTEE